MWPHTRVRGGCAHFRLLKPRLPEDPVILDVGASNGRWTREILKIFPGATVFLFEPGTAYTDEINATLDSHERLKLFPIAIGERDGPATFHVHPDPQGSTTVDWQEGNFATPTTVPMRTIDSLIKEGTLPSPTLSRWTFRPVNWRRSRAPLRPFQLFVLSIWRRGSCRPMGARSRCLWT